MGLESQIGTIVTAGIVGKVAQNAMSGTRKSRKKKRK